MQQRLIQEAPSSTAPAYDFAHDKLRPLVDRPSLARRRLLHQRVAQALMARNRKEPNLQSAAAHIARHWQLAGHLAEAAEYFYRAGEQARSVYAHAEALMHYRTALATGRAETPRRSMKRSVMCRRCGANIDRR